LSKAQDIIVNEFYIDLGSGTTTSIDLDASLGLELSMTAPEVTSAQEKQEMKSNSKGNFMKNVKGGIVALLELLVADSHPNER